jgi:hypothetical protein
MGAATSPGGLRLAAADRFCANPFVAVPWSKSRWGYLLNALSHQSLSASSVCDWREAGFPTKNVPS